MKQSWKPSHIYKRGNVNILSRDLLQLILANISVKLFAYNNRTFIHYWGLDFFTKAKSYLSWLQKIYNYFHGEGNSHTVFLTNQGILMVTQFSTYFTGIRPKGILLGSYAGGRVSSKVLDRRIWHGYGCDDTKIPSN